MIRSIHVLLLSLLLSATPALAQVAGDGDQARMDELRAQLAPGKQSFISRQMGLDSAEEAEFWPIYDAHQSELESLQQRQRELAATHAEAVASGTLDDGLARDLARGLVRIAEDEAKLLDGTYNRLRRGLTETQALQYLQLEMQVATLQRYEMTAASLP